MYIIRSFFMLTVFRSLLIHAIVKSDEITEEEYNCREIVQIPNGSEAGTGYFRINFEENYCTIYRYQVKCANKSSIIKIKSAFTDYSNFTSSEDAHRSEIQVDFRENTTFSDRTKSLVDVNKWIIDSQNKTSTKDKIFFSHTADLNFSVTVKGNLSDIHLELWYEEIQFMEYRNGSSDREGRISPWVSMEAREYRPNSVYVFQITKPEDLRANSIHLGLTKLQIDEGIGEYLLVGAGKDVFQGPPPLFISSLPSKKEIKINDENAYIVFITASTRARYSGFETTWKYNGTRINPKEDVTVDPSISDESNSMPICIYNISAALNELNKSEDSFGKFRERLASLGNEYAKNNSMNSKIDSSQVRIVRVSAVIEKNDTLYVMVKIQHTEDGKGAFNWSQMGHILNEYSSRYHSEVDNGYWIKNCPKETHRKNTTSILFYAIAPVLCCLLYVLIWNWKRTPFSRIFSNETKNVEMLPRGEEEHIRNYIANSIPKVNIFNDDGRRFTWNEEEDPFSSGADQDSEMEVFNATDLRRSNSSRSNNSRASRSVRSSTRSQKKGEINEAFDEDEEHRDDVQNISETSTSATNTLNSSRSLLSTNIIDETKM